MGEMACYEETCPQCGQVPPSKKLMYEAYERKKRQLEQKRKKQLQQVAASRAAVRSNAASASMDSKLPESGHNGKGTTTAAVIVQNSKDVAEAAKSNNAVV
ncbi:Hypothetical protein FKW44_015286 [Caligus rogercresseyi]|uniref:Uncharacterized protein n=1 Tax=Caligus rogercresseyi TaxID=217165 RepID=A0A7T8H037_CALRO|nr:Hypothetical protein FKW44_015286 [Caligus rogercresseyi]